MKNELKELQAKLRKAKKEKQMITKRYTELFEAILKTKGIELQETEYCDTVYGPASYIKTFEDVTIYLYPNMEEEKINVFSKGRSWRFNSLEPSLKLIESLH